MRGCTRMALVALVLALVGTTADARPHRAPVLKVAHVKARTPIQASVYAAIRYQRLADMYAKRARGQAWIAVCIHERTGPDSEVSEREALKVCEAELESRRDEIENLDVAP